MSLPLEYFTDEQTTPADGSYIKPEEWPDGGIIHDTDGFDREYFGEGTFRIDTGHTTIPTLPIKIEITGRTAQRFNYAYWVRVRIEFCNDGEPNEFSGGWMLLENI